MKTDQIEMYTFKKTRHVWWFGYQYQILFEETPVREVIGWTYQQVKDYVFMLNTAWNLGFGSGGIYANIELDQSKLYYESHITIEPVFDEYRSFAAGIAETYNFKLADLLMKKRSTDTETRSDKDTFMTGHSKSFKDIEKRTRDLVVALQKEGFKVWRYKIEDTLMDSRSEDVWGLLEDVK